MNELVRKVKETEMFLKYGRMRKNGLLLSRKKSHKGFKKAINSYFFVNQAINQYLVKRGYK